MTSCLQGWSSCAEGMHTWPRFIMHAGSSCSCCIVRVRIRTWQCCSVPWGTGLDVDDLSRVTLQLQPQNIMSLLLALKHPQLRRPDGEIAYSCNCRQAGAIIMSGQREAIL